MNFDQLYTLLSERKETMPENSGTTRLFQKGLPAILKKFNEECFEVGLALETQSPEDLALEVSQTYYYIYCLVVYLDLEKDHLDPYQSLSDLPEDKHSLAKCLSQHAAMVCHTPNQTTLSDILPVLNQVIRVAHTNFEQVFKSL